jgi:hypothetical protein
VDARWRQHRSLIRIPTPFPNPDNEAAAFERPVSRSKNMSHVPTTFAPLRWLTTACLVLILGLSGCARGWTSHDLEQTAIESLPANNRAAPIEAAAALTPDDHSTAGLMSAATLLQRANADPTPQAQAAQAVVVARLFRCCYDRRDLLWLTPQGSPELWSQLSETFNQSDARLRADPKNLLNAMVWARSGTALKRDAELRATLQRAATDETLRNTLCEDDPTRSLLYEYAKQPARKDWKADAAFLFREPGHGSFGERLFAAVIYVPLMAAGTVIYIITGHSPI